MAFGYIITLCVESNIYNHLFYQIIVFVAWVLVRR